MCPGEVICWFKGAVFFAAFHRQVERSLLDEGHIDFLAACDTEGGSAKRSVWDCGGYLSVNKDLGAS
jgi:hypothetical protein